MTPAEFLLARIAEDEARARDKLTRPHHIAYWDPTRVLDECLAKRKIIAAAFATAETIDGEWCCHTAEQIRVGVTDDFREGIRSLLSSCPGPKVAAEFLKPLASVYAAHPDFPQVTW